MPSRSLLRFALLSSLAFAAASAACSKVTRDFNTTPGSGGSGGATSSTGPSSSSSGTASGGGGSEPCTPKQTRSCYDGPKGTAGKGICKAGTQTCKGDGSGFGACTGEVVPAAAGDDCATPLDESCGVAPTTCTGTVDWQAAFGGMGDDEAIATAFDANGDLIVVGYFQGAANDLVSNGGADVFVVRFDKDTGAVKNDRSYGGTNDDYGYGVAVGQNGDIYVTGYFGGVADFGCGMQGVAGSTDDNGFVMQVDPTDFHCLWMQSLPDLGAGSEFRGVAVDSTGAVVVAGYDTDPSSFQENIVVEKFGGDGTMIWQQSFGPAPSAESSRVVVDAKDNPVLVAVLAGTIDFGGSSSPATVVQGDSGSNNNGILVAKLDATTGKGIWATVGQDPASIGEGLAFGLGVDPNDGSVYAGGFFNSGLAFDAATQLTTPAMTEQGFLAKLDASGKPLSLLPIGPPSESFAGPFGIAVDSFSHVVLAGAFSGDMDLGNNVTATATGPSDAFVAKLDATGKGIWVQHSGAAGNGQLAAGCAFDKKGRIGVTGFFEADLAFASSTIASLGDDDAMAVVFEP